MSILNNVFIKAKNTISGNIYHSVKAVTQATRIKNVKPVGIGAQGLMSMPEKNDIATILPCLVLKLPQAEFHLLLKAVSSIYFLACRNLRVTV